MCSYQTTADRFKVITSCIIVITSNISVNGIVQLSTTVGTYDIRMNIPPVKRNRELKNASESVAPQKRVEGGKALRSGHPYFGAKSARIENCPEVCLNPLR